jgi:hypothetical protein
MKTKSYRILSAANRKSLSEEVEKALALGWFLYGDPFINSETEGCMWNQAVAHEG